MSKVLVIGLDGATFDLIGPWAEQGVLPGFAQLLREGSYGRVRTVPNTDTAPAWTTLATGLNPANHGLFHELGWSADRRTLRPIRGGERDGAPFWKIASDAGRRMAVANFPISYPADSVNGAMLAGIDAPSVDAAGFCHPPGLLAELRRTIGDYQIDSRIAFAIKQGRPDDGLARAYAVAERHTQAFLHLLERQPWDLAVLAYSIPDEMQHFFWQQMIQNQGPQRDAIRAGYQFIERQIARLREYAGPDTYVLIVSDHGFGPLCATTTSLSNWLRAQGFLRDLAPASLPLVQRASTAAYTWLRHRLGEQSKQALRRWLPQLRNRVESDARFAAIDWATSQAYVGSSPWEIWINLRGRDPHGNVAPGAEYERIREQVIAALHGWRDAQGRPYISAVHRREEVYHGKYLDRAPDISLEWNPAAAPPAIKIAGNTSQFDADHQPQGILIAVGPGIRAGNPISGADLADVAPTVLHLLGVALPERLDGNVLTALLAEQALSVSSVDECMN
jgi:predicted AlkP superfamily phosphohydrolase/phosphomutase